ncbi:hypothetical protein GN958_ATG02943 [Phytophthora infestans]|uniref:Uncharacterized protein n=1 Tax=Phytophthora infestans TaxID=4787 RepID=A0A8S9V6V6_PHYIN|nr:hypothetical protein GN958_ATG02943 [Phytophthora infestans]
MASDQLQVRSGGRDKVTTVAATALWCLSVTGCRQAAWELGQSPSRKQWQESDRKGRTCRHGGWVGCELADFGVGELSSTLTATMSAEALSGDMASVVWRKVKQRASVSFGPQLLASIKQCTKCTFN